MCNSIVQWTMRHDPVGILHYAPLQADWVQQELCRRGVVADLGTMVFLAGDRTYLYSEAARQVGLRLQGWPRWLSMLGGLIPGILRDPVYRMIAIRRQWISTRLGLTKAQCQLLPPDQRARIHDRPELPVFVSVSSEPITTLDADQKVASP
jgi:predicted DCC family thiol-disulfide oxidoreductase YuxK